MSESAFDQEDGGFTFTDKDFERRYYSSQKNISTSGAGGAEGRLKAQAIHDGAQARRTPNKFMRTLLRRRLASAAR
jgi:hypothetical protein